MQRRKSEYLSIPESPRISSSKINCILKYIVHLIFAHRDNNVNRLPAVYSTVHSREIMDRINGNILTIGVLSKIIINYLSI